MSSYDERRPKCNICEDYHHQDFDGMADCRDTILGRLRTAEAQLALYKATKRTVDLCPTTNHAAEDHAWAGE